MQKYDKEKAEAEAAKAKAAEPAKPADGKPAEPPAAQPSSLPPVEYKYTLPETLSMNDEQRTQVHAAFDTFRADPATGAQALVDLHNDRMKEMAQFLLSEQRRIFAETRQDWEKQAKSDPELGGHNGSAYNTTLGVVARMRDLFVPENRRDAFNDFLITTGAGDHPEFLRMLHQAGRYFDEPGVPPPNPQPPANNGQRPPRRLRDIYDHTRSNGQGRS